jgi:hypothetical protein
MNAQTQSWTSEILPLDRPEYAKQPEALLTDLIWRSPGSSLSHEIKLSRDMKLLDGRELIKLIPGQIHGAKPGFVETSPFAKQTDISGVISRQQDMPSPVHALLRSIEAPRSRGDKLLAYVPIHPGLVALQTLQGLVNKSGPPNLANIIETVGWLGGSDGIGHVAHLFLRALQPQARAEEGFTGFTSVLFPQIASHTWEELAKQATGLSIPHSWPLVAPAEPSWTDRPAIIAKYNWTPFKWFWEKWYTLCNPENGWFEVLPARRFIDWSMCLLRTGLSFAYLWEADFYIKLHSFLIEEVARRKGIGNKTAARDALRAMLEEGTTLATLESPLVPASQKHAGNAINTLLAKGYEARRVINDHLDKIPFPVPEQDSAWLSITGWIASLALPDLEKLSSSLQIESTTAPNTKEFVRYLLRPRSSDDDTRDQADFYYLARTNASGSFWFEPGPEWLVVVISLLSRKSGGQCTLGMLLEDLTKLGVRVDRWILVNMLEEAGLSTDSPDADNALVIQAGF